MEKKPEMNKEPEEKKEADRSELTRSVKFVLFSISAIIYWARFKSGKWQNFQVMEKSEKIALD